MQTGQSEPSSKRLLILPDEFDASAQYYYGDEGKPETHAVNITNVAAAFFSPGHRRDTHSTLVRTDGTYPALYYALDEEYDADGDYPEGKSRHRDLIEIIELKTGQKLVEIAEYSSGHAEKIINANPAMARGFQLLELKHGPHLEPFLKGCSSRLTVDKADAQAAFMTDVTNALPDAQTIRFTADDMNSTLVVGKNAIQAVWQNYGSIYMWLDGLQAPVQVHAGGEKPEIANKIVDEILAAFSNGLKGTRLGKGLSGNDLSFYARPENIAGINSDGGTISIVFANAAGLKAESGSEPRFYIRDGAAQAAKNLILALA